MHVVVVVLRTEYELSTYHTRQVQLPHNLVKIRNLVGPLHFIYLKRTAGDEGGGGRVCFFVFYALAIIFRTPYSVLIISVLRNTNTQSIRSTPYVQYPYPYPMLSMYVSTYVSTTVTVNHYIITLEDFRYGVLLTEYGGSPL